MPINQQIVTQMQYLVAFNRLKAADEVPPIRTLPENLLINPNTVARAYRELEQAGILSKNKVLALMFQIAEHHWHGLNV